MAFLIACITVLFVGQSVAHAAPQTVDLFPNSDVSTQWARSGGADNWGRIYRTTANRVESSYVCTTANSSIDLYGAGPNYAGGSNAPIDVKQGVISMTSEASGKTGWKFLNGGGPNITVDALISGGVVGTQTSQWSGQGGLLGSNLCNQTLGGSWATTTLSATPTAGTGWTQAQINTLQLRLTRSGDSGRAAKTMSLFARLTYVPYSALQQAAYRFFAANPDSSTPGAPIAAVNTMADINKDTTTDVRLRMNVNTTTEQWLQNYGSYRLQYAVRGTGTCASPTGSWINVQSGNAIQWKSNLLVPDGTAITSSGNDPTSGTNVYQTYRSAHPFSKTAWVGQGNSAIWDFSLSIANAGDYGTVYCFRITDSDGNALSSYTQYPQLRITGNAGVDIVNSSGVSVSSPRVTFSSLYSLGACQQSTGMLGSANQRIRVTDNRPSGTWSLAIAATGGATAKWTSGANEYQFNNAAGTPPGCAFGRLGTNFASINAAPKSGCSGTGLSGSSNTPFSGATPVSIGSAAGADRFCYWDITGVGLEQQVPAATPSGTYSINMTITMTAA